MIVTMLNKLIWLVGSLTGTVSSNKVSEDLEGMLMLDGS